MGPIALLSEAARRIIGACRVKNGAIKMRILPLILLALSACSMPVDPEDEIPRICTDTRDGEKFVILPETIERASFTANDVCFDVTDSTGRIRNLCKSHEVFLKCEPVVIPRGVSEE